LTLSYFISQDFFTLEVANFYYEYNILISKKISIAAMSLRGNLNKINHFLYSIISWTMIQKKQHVCSWIRRLNWNCYRELHFVNGDNCGTECAGETNPIEGTGHFLQITRFNSCDFKASGMYFVIWLCYFVVWRQPTVCCRSFEGEKMRRH